MKEACHSDLPPAPSADCVRPVPAWPLSTWRSERLTIGSPRWRPLQSTAGGQGLGMGWERTQTRPLQLLPIGGRAQNTWNQTWAGVKPPSFRLPSPGHRWYDQHLSACPNPPRIWVTISGIRGIYIQVKLANTCCSSVNCPVNKGPS